jgi:hypothetical protein
VFIGHSFGGLIIKQVSYIMLAASIRKTDLSKMLVNASADTSDEFCQAVVKNTQGFIFLGTPHKVAHLTFFGRVMSLFGHWTGASTSLLEVVRPNSNLNESLHRSFMRYLAGHCGPQNTVCVFETVSEAIFGFPVIQVSAASPDMAQAQLLRGLFPSGGRPNFSGDRRLARHWV